MDTTFFTTHNHMDTTWKHIPIKKKDLEAYDNDPSNATHKVCFMIILLHNSLGGGGG